MDAVGLRTDLTDLDHSAHLLTAALNTIYVQYLTYLSQLNNRVDAVGLRTDLTDLDHSAHLLTAALNTIYVQYLTYL